MVKQGTDQQGFYLHEVELKEKLENASKTANGSAFPASRLILSQLLDKIKLKYGKDDRNVRSIKRFAAPFYTGKTFAEAYITVKESIQAGHRIYSLELDE